MPEVCVVVPVRDAAATLPAALESIRRQSFADWECIVVDDGSHDDSAAVARAFGAGDARFRVLAQPRLGVAAAANAGVRAATAPLIARMDADDVMRRHRLALQVEALRDAGLAGVGTHVRLFPDARLGDGMRRYQAWLNAITSPEDVARDRFIECPLANPSLMLRRETLAAYGWRAPGWPDDYDLVLRLLGDGHRLGVVPRRLLAWRHGPERLTTAHADYTLERFTACRAHYLARGFLRDAGEYVLWGYGATGRTLRTALAVHDKRPSHIVELHPRRLGNVIQGAAVVAPQVLRVLPRRPIVVSVAGAGPRAQIRAALRDMGFVETVDFVCAA